MARFITLGLWFVAFCGIALAQQDLTLVYRINTSGDANSLENGAKLTVYIQGKKLRTDYEFNTPMGITQSYTIHRCDLGRVWSLTPLTHNPFYIEYIIPIGAERERLPFHLLHSEPAGAATNYRVDVTWELTGETKDAFGFTARRFRRVVDESGSEQLKLGAIKTVESVWYLDIPSVTPCYTEALRPEFSGQPNLHDRKRIQAAVQQHGEAPAGVELRNEHTITKTVPWRDPSTYSAHESKFVIELVELKQGTLDPRMFEIPPGFSLYSSNKR
jgi:hypothetical protein